jgi:hypothetical protein
VCRPRLHHFAAKALHRLAEHVVELGVRGVTLLFAPKVLTDGNADSGEHLINQLSKTFILRTTSHRRTISIRLLPTTHRASPVRPET